MDKKLKEAIADAKTVRETALANAKLALQEAFSPKLQSMISAKLREEAEEEEELVDDETMDAPVEDELPVDDAPIEDEMGEEEFADDEFGTEEDEELPVGEEELTDDEFADDEDDMELEAMIRELENEEPTEEEDEMAPVAEEEEELDAPVVAPEVAPEEEEEEFDLEEIIRSLREEDEVAPEEEEEKAPMVPESKLKEAYAVIKTLRDSLNEVNVLNAKLLYANKLFRTYSLSENVKAKIVEAIDRAGSVREIKLVYSTLAENFRTNTSVVNKKKTSIKEGFASKAQPSTKPKQIITEVSAQVSRFQKLAGIKK